MRKTITALLLIACYKMRKPLNRMFRRLQTDRLTELRQITEFARLAFLITFSGLAKVGL